MKNTKVHDSIEEVNINSFVMKTLNSCPHYHNVEKSITYECCKNVSCAA